MKSECILYWVMTSLSCLDIAQARSSSQLDVKEIYSNQNKIFFFFCKLFRWPILLLWRLFLALLECRHGFWLKYLQCLVNWNWIKNNVCMYEILLMGTKVLPFNHLSKHVAVLQIFFWLWCYAFEFTRMT